MMARATLSGCIARAGRSGLWLPAFSRNRINPIFGAGKPVGGLDGHWGQVGNQVVGVLIAWIFALVGTLVLLKIVDLITGIRGPEEHEIEGLDITQHAQQAYNLNSYYYR